MAQPKANLDTKNQLLYVELSPGLYGGFKKQLLHEQSPPTLLRTLLCCKCDNIVRNAVATSELLACSSCTDSWATMVKKRLTVDNEVRKKVSKLVAHCPLKERGCDWVGELEGISRHMEMCSYLCVICPMGCEDNFLRGQVEDHMKECSNRRVSCRYCIKQLRAHKETQHLLTCPGYPVKCVQGCEKEVIRNQMNKHVSTECDESIIECPYSKLGCQREAIRRCEMLVHTKDTSDEHADLMISAIVRMESASGEKLVTLEKRCESGRIDFEKSTSDFKNIICKKMDTLSKRVSDCEGKIKDQKSTEARINELKTTLERQQSGISNIFSMKQREMNDKISRQQNVSN